MLSITAGKANAKLFFRVPDKINRSTENELARLGTEGEAGHLL
ncbi:MAG: hypothetical protein ACYS6K_06145 [Planctomycetota bacterium]